MFTIFWWYAVPDQSGLLSPLVKFARVRNKVYTSGRIAHHAMFTCFSMFPLNQMTLRHEDGDDETQLPPSARKDRRRASVGTTNERRGLERRRSRRHSLQNSRGHASAPASPSSPHPHASSFLPFGGQRIEDISER